MRREGPAIQLYIEWVTSKMMTEPLWPFGVQGQIAQTQGCSLREQPWAFGRNSVGVEDIDNSDQSQISSYREAACFRKSSGHSPLIHVVMDQLVIDQPHPADCASATSRQPNMNGRP